MSQIEGVEGLKLLPDRLSIAEFSPLEIAAVRGSNPAEHDINIGNFNWVAAYLVEEVGLYEGEVTEWFKSGARGLDDESPLRVWGEEDGYQQVFDYAQQYKDQVDEDLAGEPLEYPDVVRSRDYAKGALEVILKAFEIAEVEVGINLLPEELSKAVHNPDNNQSLVVRWKKSGHMEDYRVTRQDGTSVSTYFVVRYYDWGKAPVILQTGISRRSSADSKAIIDMDTDLDGRPPSVREVSGFIVPLANEVRKKTLVPIG